MVRLILLCLLVVGCTTAAPKYKGKLTVHYGFPKQIQKDWELFSNSKTPVRGWATWGKTQEGKDWCVIHVPWDDKDRAVYKHELRHCIEGQWHGGPAVYYSQ